MYEPALGFLVSISEDVSQTYDILSGDLSKSYDPIKAKIASRSSPNGKSALDPPFTKCSCCCNPTTQHTAENNT